MNHLLILCVISAAFFMHQTYAENENATTNVTTDLNKTYVVNQTVASNESVPTNVTTASNQMNQTNVEYVNVTLNEFLDSNFTGEANESNSTKKPDLYQIMLDGFDNLTQSGILPAADLIDKFTRHLILDTAILQASEKFRDNVTDGTIDFCNKASGIRIDIIGYVAHKAADFCLFLDYMSIAYPVVNNETDKYEMNTNETNKSSQSNETTTTRKSLIEIYMDDSIQKNAELTKNGSSPLMECYKSLGSKVDDYFLAISSEHDKCTIEYSNLQKLAKIQSANVTESINITTVSSTTEGTTTTTTEIPTTTLSVEEKANKLGVSPDEFKSLFEEIPDDAA